METRLQLIDENFESQQSGKSDLLIHIGQESISYAIVDKGREQLKALVDYQAVLSDLNSIMQSDRHLKYFYRKIKIATNTFKFTFIPRDLYSVSEVGDYAKYISPKSSADVQVNDIRSFKIKNVMAIDADLQHTLSSRFQQPVIYSQANPFIEGACTVAIQPIFNLCINIQPETLEMALIKDGYLLFYNIFEINSPDEFNYFLLLLIKQFDLNADNSAVKIAGKIELNDSNYVRLEKYFSAIHFADPRGFVQCSEAFDNVNFHQYFSLLSLNLCE